EAGEQPPTSVEGDRIQRTIEALSVLEPDLVRVRGPRERRAMRDRRQGPALPVLPHERKDGALGSYLDDRDLLAVGGDPGRPDPLRFVEQVTDRELEAIRRADVARRRELLP